MRKCYNKHDNCQSARYSVNTICSLHTYIYHDQSASYIDREYKYMIMMKGPQVIGILIHIIAVLTVWVLFLLPVIFYYRSREGGSIQYINDLTNFFQSLKGICLPKSISSNEVCELNTTSEFLANVTKVYA